MKRCLIFCLIVLFSFMASSCSITFLTDDVGLPSQSLSVDYGKIPPYSGKAYVAVNGNMPSFAKEDLTTVSFESYSPLDDLRRCGTCVASIGQDLMPTESRESISSVKPTGWHSVQYDFVDGKSLYNRCHLIGFQLTAENANRQNLITGTRYLNVEGMLPFENMVADYVQETGNHVLYRVTPHFEGDNLLASGVYMEGFSVEDGGEGICFFVYCYNVQPGVVLNYATGESYLEQADEGTLSSTQENKSLYILNISSKKFHSKNCSGAKDIKAGNKKETSLAREVLIKQGFIPCKSCNP